MSTFPDESHQFARPGEPPAGAQPFAVSYPSSRLPLAGGVLLAVVAEAFLALALAFSGDSQLLLVKLGVPMISGLFALGSCLLVCVALQGRERAAWVLMGLACLGVLVAQGTRFVPSSVGANLPLSLAGSYPSVASLALIAQSLGFFLAFLLFPPPTRNAPLAARVGQFFDGVLVVGAALVAVLYFVLIPLARSANGALAAGQVTTLAICVSDLLLLGGLTFALRSLGARHSPLSGALGIVALAMLLIVAADFASMALTPDQFAPASSLLQAAWNAGYLGIGLGALLRLRSGGRSSPAEEAAGAAEEGFSIWVALPFVLAVVVAGAITVHALTRATTPTQMLIAVVCASLLVALIGARYLVALLGSHQTVEQRRALERGVALAEERAEQLRSGQIAQARARRESLDGLLETLSRFGYGDYRARIGPLERELAPLGERLNALLDGVDRQLADHDRGREMRLIAILTDALGRLALGELHDLPELPAPGSSPLDGLMMSVVQVRTRLMNLQTTVQQYEAEHYEARQQLEYARQELEQEAQAQRSATMEMTQTLEGKLHSERQVAQATEEQWQRERERILAQAQAAEARAAAAEGRLLEIEAMRDAAEKRLLAERQAAEQRLEAERQALEQRLQDVPRADPAQVALVRQRGEQLVMRFTSQAERLHTAAATLQTAAEVAQRLGRMIQETAALPEIQGAGQASGAPAAQPAEAAPAASLSAMQMLERLAGRRGGDTTPRMPAAAAASAGATGMLPGKAVSGPLDGAATERAARRLHMAASRAEEIAGGLLELAEQCIQAGEESVRAAEEAGKFSEELEAPAPVVPAVIRRTMLPARAPKSGR